MNGGFIRTYNFIQFKEGRKQRLTSIIVGNKNIICKKCTKMNYFTHSKILLSIYLIGVVFS